ncbi:MAG: hypothetical protein P9X24_14380 [Candidatus Hatepunaea meridiana]|nr:hypothetical protein [Candidatus Hatepunaea meridiana]
MKKYIASVIIGFAIIILMLCTNRYLFRKFEGIPADSTALRKKVIKVVTADGYEPEVVVVSLSDSLYHLAHCGWKGDSVKYMYARDVIPAGFKPCPHCFGDE